MRAVGPQSVDSPRLIAARLSTFLAYFRQSGSLHLFPDSYAELEPFPEAGARCAAQLLLKSGPGEELQTRAVCTAPLDTQAATRTLTVRIPWKYPAAAPGSAELVLHRRGQIR